MKLTLKEIRKQTGEASTFIFTPDGPVSYMAGQHLSIQLHHEHPDERGTVRTFTMSSSPTEEGIIDITTKNGPSSFKQALFSLPIGTSLEARDPRGSIYLTGETSGEQVYVAGGIGITPFRSMIRYAFDTKLPIPIVLLYSNKAPEEIVFKKELDEIAQAQPSIAVHYTITQPVVGSTVWTGRVGRIDETFIKEHVQNMLTATFYIAGPTGMVEGMIEILKTPGVQPEHIKFEKFSGY